MFFTIYLDLIVDLLCSFENTDMIKFARKHLSNRNKAYVHTTLNFSQTFPSKKPVCKIFFCMFKTFVCLHTMKDVSRKSDIGDKIQVFIPLK